MAGGSPKRETGSSGQDVKVMMMMMINVNFFMSSTRTMKDSLSTVTKVYQRITSLVCKIKYKLINKTNYLNETQMPTENRVSIHIRQRIMLTDDGIKSR